MYDKNLADGVKRILNVNPGRLYRLKELYTILHVRKHKHRDLRDTLFGMVKDKEIILSGKSYKALKQTNKRYLTGTFDARPLARGKNFAFVISEEMDVFISSEDTLDAYDGDTVKIEVRSGRKDKFYGIVIKVEKRYRDEIIGTVNRYHGKTFLEPDNSRIHTQIDINNIGKAVQGDKVVLKVTNWGNRQKYRFPAGEVTEILGKSGDPEVEVLSVIRHFNLPLTFPSKVLNEVEKISSDITEYDLKGRKDFRDLITFTIDPASAKDFDDAISYETNQFGSELYVHIADVSHYVKPGSEVFKEAFERGNSYYFPKRVIPMLPFKLSNNVCSLRPNEDKLVMTVCTKFDKEFKITSQNIYQAVICSDRRFAYEEIDDYYAGKLEIEDDLSSRLDKLSDLSLFLSEKRNSNGYLHFDLPETVYVFDDDGHVVDLVRSSETLSHKMIENCMLIANEYTAKLLGTHSTMYRIHDKPSEEKLINLSDTMARNNIKFSVGKNLNKSIQKLLDSLPDKTHHRVFDKLILRSMQKARYSVVNKGHFGLALKNYTHFTSPIRRLCDLVIHHQLKDIVTLRERSFDKKTLLEFSEQASTKEVIAADSEREVDFKNKMLFMKKHLGEEFEGIVVGMKNDGLIVELDRYPVTGLVDFNSITEERFTFMPKQMVVTSNKGKKFKMTDPIKVFVNRVADDIFFGLME